MVDFEVLIADLVRDEQSRLGSGSVDTALALALARYGVLRPLHDGAGAVLPASAANVPAADGEAVCCYAASLLLTQLAASAMNDSDSMLVADSVNRSSRSEGYAKRARELLTRFETLMGLAGAGGGSAGNGQPLPAGGVLCFVGRPRNRTWWPVGG